MTPTAGILLFLSALTHAGWNVLSKKDHPTLAFYMVANTIGVLCILPLFFFYWRQLSLVPSTVWHYVNVSGFCLAAYMAALAGAYRSGDISIAYPIARSLPVVFVTVATAVFGFGKAVGFQFAAGALLIVAGCIILPLKDRNDLKVPNYFNACAVLALLAALFIAAYTIVDHQALEKLRSVPGKPLSPLDATLIYMAVEAVSATLWKAVFILFSRGEKQNLTEVFKSFKRSAALTGIGIYLTYGLVLLSMNYVDNVSYVAAFRQLSIPVGAISGILFLGEPCFRLKILGLILLLSGLVLVYVF